MQNKPPLFLFESIFIIADFSTLHYYYFTLRNIKSSVEYRCNNYYFALGYGAGSNVVAHATGLNEVKEAAEGYRTAEHPTILVNAREPKWKRP